MGGWVEDESGNYTQAAWAAIHARSTHLTRSCAAPGLIAIPMASPQHPWPPDRL